MSARIRIRDLNDRFRRSPLSLGRAVVTRGVAALGGDFAARAMSAVAAHSAFNADCDPHGEHDFGALEIDGERLFWKIDYYQRGSDYAAGAENPDDAGTTDRVLTVMLASEY
jgi:Protein of unknown function (DUF3768)